MFIDTHCHIDSYEEHSGEKFEDLLARMKENCAEDAVAGSCSAVKAVAGSCSAVKVVAGSCSAEDAVAGSCSAEPCVTMPEAFVHVACDPAGFEYARNISEKYPFVYAAYGIHPEYVETETAEDEARLVEMLKHPRCVACGEFGLDYHYDKEHRAEQVKLFERHLKIGIASGKPLVLHLREADEDALAVLRGANLKDTKVHVHCFTGTADFVSKLLELDMKLFVGFTGIITFKNAPNVREAAALVPLDQLLLETDAPYMAPVPFRGTPCHSGYIPYVAHKLAEVKNVPVEELYRHCRENTRNCYGI